VAWHEPLRRKNRKCNLSARKTVKKARKGEIGKAGGVENCSRDSTKKKVSRWGVGRERSGRNRRGGGDMIMD